MRAIKCDEVGPCCACIGCTISGSIVICHNTEISGSHVWPISIFFSPCLFFFLIGFKTAVFVGGGDQCDPLTESPAVRSKWQFRSYPILKRYSSRAKRPETLLSHAFVDNMIALADRDFSKEKKNKKKKISKAGVRDHKIRNTRSGFLQTLHPLSFKNAKIPQSSNLERVETQELMAARLGHVSTVAQRRAR